MRNEVNAELNRGVISREEWIQWRMADVPPIYLALMPVSSSAETLRNAEENIRAMVARDVKRLTENPWRVPGDFPRAVDFTTLPENEVDDLEINSRAETGYPAIVRDGFEDHPAVLRVFRRVNDPGSPKTIFLDAQQDVDDIQAKIQAMLNQDDIDRDVFDGLIKQRDALLETLEAARAGWPDAPKNTNVTGVKLPDAPKKLHSIRDEMGDTRPR